MARSPPPAAAAAPAHPDAAPNDAQLPFGIRLVRHVGALVSAPPPAAPYVPPADAPDRRAPPARRPPPAARRPPPAAHPPPSPRRAVCRSRWPL